MLVIIVESYLDSGTTTIDEAHVALPIKIDVEKIGNYRLGILENWVEQWKMGFNLNLCRVMHWWIFNKDKIYT